MDFLTIFFVLPTVFDYSTRVNVLFFYMTWTTLVMSHTALRLELWGTLLVRLVFFFFPSIVFFIFDTAASSTAVSFKERGEAGLPTGSKRTKPMVKEAKIAGWAIANFALSFTLQMLLEGFLIKTPGLRPAIQTSLSIPMPWRITTQLLWGFLARETLYYTIHRFILHSKLPVFAYLVKCHGSWYHSLITPFPLTAHYDHPAAYLLSTFIPMYLPALFFRFHMITFLVYTVIISLEETLVFSGYSAMPSYFLVAAARRVEAHLAADGRSHFGRWGIADILAGTGGYGEFNAAAGDGGSSGTRR
ncbi:hypothetical protein BDW66DRAFT_159741 [Aspergillus desertorum]